MGRTQQESTRWLETSNTPTERPATARRATTRWIEGGRLGWVGEMGGLSDLS